MTIPQTIYAVPVGGLKVRIPGKPGHLKPEGEKVPFTSYWRRRAAERSVGTGATLREAQTRAKEMAPDAGKASAKAPQKTDKAKDQ